jgi:hypothetical protein
MIVTITLRPQMELLRLDFASELGKGGVEALQDMPCRDGSQVGGRNGAGINHRVF